MFYLRRMIPMMALALFVVVAGTVQAAGELRGAWVTAWDHGFLTPEEADATVAAAKRANLNALFVQVRKTADAYYDSTTDPRGSGIASGYDPLARIVENAHAEGIEVHAWANVFRVWSGKELPSDPNHVVNRHPEWLNKTFSGSTRAEEGLYLDPGVPEVREYIASVVSEIARKYAVDGVHLDYIRYPGREWGYSDLALRQYYIERNMTSKPDPNDSSWLQWRRDQVTETVRMVREKVRAAKPSLVISAATVPWGDCAGDFCLLSPYKTVCQDWRSWTSDGLLDANVPMNYKSEKSVKCAKEFRNWLTGFGKWSGGKPVYVGIDVVGNQAADVVRQINAVRKYGLHGFVLFSFNQGPRRLALVDALRAGPCKNPAMRQTASTR